MTQVKPMWLLALPVLLAAEPAAAQAQRFELDPEHTFAHFEVLHFGTSTLRGRVGPIGGEVTIDPRAGRGRVALRIDMRTLDTGLKLLDARLRQSDLLDVAGHPEAYFVAERFRFDDERPAELTGEFTLRGVGSSLTLRAERFGCLDTAAGLRCGGDFVGELLRSSFGATYGLPLIADRVQLRVQVEALQQR